MKLHFPSLAALLIVSLAAARPDAPLKTCWKAQGGGLTDTYLAQRYEEGFAELYHSPRPWQQMHYAGRGRIWLSAQVFRKQDTLVAGARTLSSLVQLDTAQLLLQDYGRDKLSDISPSRYAEALTGSARYTPLPLLGYFVRANVAPAAESNQEFAVYETLLHKTLVRLYIRKKTARVTRITTLEPDELRGDVLSEYVYGDYATAAGLSYPRSITIDKLGGRLKDTVRIMEAALVSAAPQPLRKPEGYAMISDAPDSQQLALNRYNEHLHFISLQPNGSRVAIVEFRDFLLVAEAPLSSRNGERIIAAARAIAPGKPVRYFSFGHHHPDYIGGLRAFVHKGATILGVPEDRDYVSFLATAPHSLDPDSLQLQPRPLLWQGLQDSLEISDGSYAMKIYHIGSESGHTEDYLIYYFPEEKLLIEGDLVWIRTGAALTKAGSRQAGLYRAIKNRGLQVRTIMQSWGHSMPDYKMDIPFEEFERAAVLAEIKRTPDR